MKGLNVVSTIITSRWTFLANNSTRWCYIVSVVLFTFSELTTKCILPFLVTYKPVTITVVTVRKFGAIELPILVVTAVVGTSGWTIFLWFGMIR